MLRTSRGWFLRNEGTVLVLPAEERSFSKAGGRSSLLRQEPSPSQFFMKFAPFFVMNLNTFAKAPIPLYILKYHDEQIAAMPESKQP